MKKYLSKKYQQAEISLENLTSGATVRLWNMAKKLDQGHSRREANMQIYSFVYKNKFNK